MPCCLKKGRGAVFRFNFLSGQGAPWRNNTMWSLHSPGLRNLGFSCHRLSNICFDVRAADNHINKNALHSGGSAAARSNSYSCSNNSKHEPQHGASMLDWGLLKAGSKPHAKLEPPKLKVSEGSGYSWNP